MKRIIALTIAAASLAACADPQQGRMVRQSLAAVEYGAAVSNPQPAYQKPAYQVQHDLAVKAMLDARAFGCKPNIQTGSCQ